MPQCWSIVYAGLYLQIHICCDAIYTQHVVYCLANKLSTKKMSILMTSIHMVCVHGAGLALQFLIYVEHMH